MTFAQQKAIVVAIENVMGMTDDVPDVSQLDKDEKVRSDRMPTTADFDSALMARERYRSEIMLIRCSNRAILTANIFSDGFVFVTVYLPQRGGGGDVIFTAGTESCWRWRWAAFHCFPRLHGDKAHSLPWRIVSA